MIFLRFKTFFLILVWPKLLLSDANLPKVQFLHLLLKEGIKIKMITNLNFSMNALIRKNQKNKQDLLKK